jgi:rubrerythrin
MAMGKKGDMPGLIEELATLERDAVAAYDAAIDRLEDADNKAKVAQFREDHVQHLEELEKLAQKHGGRFPLDPGALSILTTGKVAIADLVGGDGAILKAMGTNEVQTVTAYENASANDAVPAEDRSVFERALEDERRHKAWMEEAGRAPQTA